MQEVHMRLLTIKYCAKSKMSGLLSAYNQAQCQIKNEWLLSANDKMSQKSKWKQKWKKGDIFFPLPT